MSLLLDALKRAEQAKQAKQSDAPGLELAGADYIPPPESSKPAAASIHESSLSMELEAMPPIRATERPTPESSDRDSARNVFTAKQSRSVSRTSKANWMIPVAGVAAIAVGAGGWFVWKEISRLSGPSSVPPVRTSAAPAPIITTPPAPPEASPATPIADAPLAAVSPAKLPLPETVAGSRSALSPAERAREDLARSLKAPTNSAEAPVTLRLTKGIEAPRVSEELATAYTALRSGNNADARNRYSALVAKDGNNLDARLGLATALARGNDRAAAMREYRKSLEIDPRNSTALAALLVLTDSASMPGLETDLKTLLSRYPDSAALSFALGNVLSAQSRWTEAQQAYFDAWRFEPENADYAFNLAVSLDHLKQPRLALDYYLKALALAGRQGTSQFDRGQAERRANELKSGQ